MTIMDIYLPADFYALRETLNDWRDAGTSFEPAQSPATTVDSPNESNACTDPDWRVF
jgi:hypothetical protein